MSDGKALEILTPLDELDAKLRLAVEFYCNPLFGRTFGNKTQAALAAGYEGKYATKALHGVGATKAIGWIMAQKDADSQHVADYLTRFSMDAARKLVEQIGMADGLNIKLMPDELLDKDPEPIIGVDKNGDEKLLGYNNAHLQRAKAITDHNKAVASAAREVREALKILLAYHLGTPEQKVSVEHGKKGTDPLDLAQLDDGELQELARHVQSVRSFKRGDDIPVTQAKKKAPPQESGALILEAEIIEEPTEVYEPQPPAPTVSKTYAERGLPF